MTRGVIDTNVAIVANGDTVQVDDDCQLACIASIRAITAGGVVFVDDHGLIFDEYRRNLSLGGQGVGDALVKHIHDNQWSGVRVQQVSVTPTDDARGFAELPENELDRSDRKFLAVACVARVPVWNATDSDWAQNASLIQQLGVEVRQLCPRYADRGGRS